jgi:hypothetical protein
VAGESRLLPTVLPVPHSYTPLDVPPVAVKVMAVDTPLHIVGMSDDKPVSTEGVASTITNAAFDVTEQAPSPTTTVYVALLFNMPVV